MKLRNFFILLLLMFSTVFSYTQNSGKQNCKMQDEKIKSEKVAFITNKLNLTVKEAQEFWPVYNEFDEKMDKLFVEEHKLMRELHKGMQNMSDKEIEAKMDRINTIKINRTDLESEYYAMFKKVLPIKKVALLYQSEREFRRYLLQKYKEKPCEP